jgi:NADP-dependent 3-hydroxy acid dehydrogenase YdfG
MSHRRTLLITGASRGIGAATARSAVAAGWRVGLAARSTDALDALVDELGAADALAVGCDVTSWPDQQRAVAATIDRFGGIDAVLANAGIFVPSGFLASTPEDWERLLLTNVLGPALTIRAVLGHFLERGRGHVVITSSVSGRRSKPGSMYAASKHAVTGMAEALRAELRVVRQNTSIRVTVVEPGWVDTAMFVPHAPEGALEAGDVARAILHALDQPARVDVNEILLRPATQAD